MVRYALVTIICRHFDAHDLTKLPIESAHDIPRIHKNMQNFLATPSFHCSLATTVDKYCLNFYPYMHLTP